MQRCRFPGCPATVKPGRNCVQCGAPVCRSHRREEGGGLFSSKRVACDPPCHGIPPEWAGAPPPPPGAVNGQASPGGVPSPGRAPYPPPPPPVPQHALAQQSLHPGVAAIPPSAPLVAPQQAQPQPQAQPQAQSQGPPHADAGTGSSAGTDHGEALRDVPCAGDPLPALPVPDESNCVQVNVAGTNLTASMDQPGITAFMQANNVEGRFRPGECIQYIVSGAAQGGVVTQRHRAVLLGVCISDPTQLIVFERTRPSGGGYSHSVATVPSFAVPSLAPLGIGRCRHCGCLVPMDEAKYHVEIVHKRGGTTTRVDEKLGTCCGNVRLLTSLLKVRKLGEGAQGEVWLSALPPPPDSPRKEVTPDYVVKVVKCSSQEEANKRYQQSVRLMNLTNTHVVKYLAVQLPPARDLVRVVMPFYAEGDLSKLIGQVQRVEESFLCSVLLQLAQALEFLHAHSPPIIHGDIKPENIMLFNNRTQVVMMDFDTAIEVTTSTRLVRSETGTMHWQAPEACNYGQANLKTDTWSLGLVVYCLAVLPEYPMVENKEGELKLFNDASWTSTDLQAIVYRDVAAKKYTPEMARLVSEMLAHDLTVRPSALGVVERVTSIMTERLLRGEE